MHTAIIYVLLSLCGRECGWRDVGKYFEKRIVLCVCVRAGVGVGVCAWDVQSERKEISTPLRSEFMHSFCQDNKTTKIKQRCDEPPFV